MLKVTDFPAFKDWFFDKFSEWEKTQPGKRSTYTAFAEYLSKNSFRLEVKQQYVSNWSKGTEPSEKYIPVLAEILGNEIYKILNATPPNPYLQRIISVFENLSAEHQRKLSDDAELYKVNNLEEHIQKSSKQRKKRNAD